MHAHAHSGCAHAHDPSACLATPARLPTPLQALESSLHTRDDEILRLTRRLDASRGTESEAALKASVVQVGAHMRGEAQCGCVALAGSKVRGC